MVPNFWLKTPTGYQTLPATFLYWDAVRKDDILQRLRIGGQKRRRHRRHRPGSRRREGFRGGRGRQGCRCLRGHRCGLRRTGGQDGGQDGESKARFLVHNFPAHSLYISGNPRDNKRFLLPLFYTEH